eukprot:RCo040256
MKWLLATDGSSSAQKALANLASLTTPEDEIVFYKCYSLKKNIPGGGSFVDPYGKEDSFDILEASKKKWKELQGQGKISGVAQGSLDCRAAIVDYATSHGVEKIMMGTRGLSPMKKAIYGSVSAYVMKNAKNISVVVTE